MTLMIWGSAAVAYVVFRLWYDGLSRPLSRDEIDEFLAELSSRAERGLPEQDVDVYRRFMEEDDGKEFLMANLIKLEKSPVVHPDTGKKVGSRQLLLEYFRPFMGAMLKSAGHPVVSTRVVGDYFDEKNMSDNPQWDMVSYVRYRSRRDAIRTTVANREFDAIHRYKMTALQKTFALPTHTVQSMYLSPRLSVGLLLIVFAQSAQLLLR